jgi:hypothetical protein
VISFKIFFSVKSVFLATTGLVENKLASLRILLLKNASVGVFLYYLSLDGLSTENTPPCGGVF